MKLLTGLALAGLAAGYPGRQGSLQTPLGAEGGDVNAKVDWKVEQLLALLAGQVVPDVLAPFQPGAVLEVDLSANASTRMGNQVNVSDIKHRPRFIQLYRPTVDLMAGEESYNKDVTISIPTFDERYGDSEDYDIDEVSDDEDEDEDDEDEDEDEVEDEDEDEDDFEDGDSYDDGQLVKRAAEPSNCDNLVIALTDPDAPSQFNRSLSEVAHYLLYCHANNVTELLSYFSPSPPKKTGLHRYTWVALAPSNSTRDKLTFDLPKSRYRWGASEGDVLGVETWAHLHGLQTIGANFVVAEHKKDHKKDHKKKHKKDKKHHKKEKKHHKKEKKHHKKEKKHHKKHGDCDHKDDVKEYI